MPFVFAVWAMKKSLDESLKNELNGIIKQSLEKSELDFVADARLHGKEIGWSEEETRQYLEGFNFHLGEREREAMFEFRKLVEEIEIVTIK
jgi:predicted solute-binding protein